MSTSIASEPTASTPLLSQAHHQATIRLNRPLQHNRIEPDDLLVLREMLAAVDANHDIRVLILTASGKSFSSGYHLGDLQVNRPASAPTAPQPSIFAQVADQLENLRIPTICALNGSVYGGSTDLALACDFRIGVAGMKLRMPAARLGLNYYASGLRRYVSRLGLAAAKKMFLTAATLDTDELLKIGYLDEVVAPDELMGRAHGLADLLAANAPLVVSSMKRFLNQIARGESDDAAMDAAHAASLASDDAKEGLAAWFERREPRFQGR